MQQCYFCTNNIKEIDYKEAETLKRFLDPQSKILSKEKQGFVQNINANYPGQSKPAA